MNAVLIGGSYGIGRELARILAVDGFNVHVYSRTLEDPFHEASIEWHEYAVGDELSDLPDTIDAFAYLPGTINLKPFRSLKPDAFREDFETNVVGAVEAIHQVSAGLKNSSNASALMFSTVAVQTGMAFHASVAASKGAVEGLTRSLAAEWAPKIRVNAIAPSLTDTPLAGRLLGNDAKAEAAAERHPLKRVGKASDIAQMAAFLLSSRSSWITGQVLPIDGGMSSIR